MSLDEGLMDETGLCRSIRIPPRAMAFVKLVLEFLKIKGFLKRCVKLG